MSTRLLTLTCLAAVASAQQPASLSIEQKEAFLTTAKIQRTYSAKKGITGTIRATMSDGTLTHDASIQTIDDRKTQFQTPQGSELNFQDSFKLNIAAYRLARMLGLGGMVPVSVERNYAGKTGSYTWWIEDIQIDEMDRLKKKLDAPDKDRWGRQTHIMRVFDALIYNVDRNQTNILYDKNWDLWLIDHSRSFRRHTTLPNPKVLDRCDGVLLEKIKKLDAATLKQELGEYLDGEQLKAILARSKRLVAHFEAKGASSLYDYLPAQ